MAPDPDALKRKRSRPSDWWAAPVTTPPQQNERPPRKRARSSGSGLTERTIQEAPAAANRGKTAASQDGPSDEGGKPVPKKKRGRPSTSGVNEQAPTSAPSEAENQTVKKKRGRPSVSKTEGATEKQAEEQPVQKKKRGRPSLQRAEEQDPTGAPAEAESSKGPRRGRASNTQRELEASQQPVSKSQDLPEKRRRLSGSGAITTKRRTRRSDASDTAVESQAVASSLATSQKARKSRKVIAAATEDEGSEANAIARHKSKRRRKEADTSVRDNAKSNDQEERPEPRRSQKSTQDDEETPQTEKPPEYQHLAEVTHRVSRQTIEAKWESLPARCIELVSSLLEDIQRPVVVRLGDERRRAQASTALQMVSRRLVSKISKGLPFPQSTGARREDDFDFEKILNRSRDLEAELTLALHANDLLESEIRKETAHLEAEEETLLQLETNAKTEASRRKDAGRKLHLLLQSEDPAMTDDSLKDETGLAPDAPEPQLSLDDENLAEIFGKLGNHVDSIQTNIKQAHGITQAMATSRAAVQATLFNHLERAQYEDIVLG